MKVSNGLIEALKEFEKFRPKAYWDKHGKVWTCGYGTTLHITENSTCMEEQALKWVRRDIAPIERFLNTVSEINTQNKFDACADFCYNLGTPTFKKSTLLKRIQNKYPLSSIQDGFRMYVYSNHVKLEGLVKRREYEAQLFVK